VVALEPVPEPLESRMLALAVQESQKFVRIAEFGYTGRKQGVAPPHTLAFVSLDVVPELPSQVVGRQVAKATHMLVEVVVGDLKHSDCWLVRMVLAVPAV